MKPCFIDGHCHIDIYSDKEINQIIKDSRKKDVGIIINNGLTPKVNLRTLELSKKYPEIKATLGIYPNECIEMSNEEIEKEIYFIKENKNKIIGIGEVGIDLYETKELFRQEIIFKKFIELSKEIKKPLIVHSRKAEEKVIEILEKQNAEKVIMHCFSGNFKLVQRIIRNKWILSIPTNVTFSEHFQKVIKISPAGQLLCETDSPFLHPEKGKRNNTPVNVIESYKKIAEIKELTLEEVKNIIFNNYLRIFS